MKLGLGLDITRTSGNSLARFAVNGFTPAVVASFEDSTYAASGATMLFDDLLVFARASKAWKTDATGATVECAIDEPRTGHHIWKDGELVPAGIAVSSMARTNLVLNSATLSTQSVTVTAVEHVLHFVGTGTVTLSGASTDGPLVGTGATGADRVSLTFTPTAGSLTLTVTGSVTLAQLEIGAYPTDYIPTAGTQVTVAAETLSVNQTKLTAALGGSMPASVSMAIDGYMTYEDENAFNTVRHLAWVLDADNRIRFEMSTSGVDTGQMFFVNRIGGTNYQSSTLNEDKGPGLDVPFSYAARCTSDEVQGASSGNLRSFTSTTGIADLSASPFSLADVGNMAITSLRIWADDIDGAGLTEATTVPLSAISPTEIDVSEGAAWSQQFSVSGGETPYVWSISAGSLPGDGVLSGDTASGTTGGTGDDAYSFTIKVTDDSGAFVTRAISGTVGAGGNPLPVAAATLHFALSNNPDGCDLDGDGNLWVAGANGAGLTKFAGFSSTVDFVEDATGDYRGVAYDPVGDNVFGAEFDDIKIRVYAAADGAIVTNYNTLDAPRDVCIFDGRLMVCSNDTLWVYTDLTTDTLLQTHTFTSLGLSAQNPAAMGTDGNNIMIGGDTGEAKIFTGASLLTATPVLLDTLAITDYEPSGFMHDGTNWYGCDRGTTDGIYIHANA